MGLKYRRAKAQASLEIKLLDFLYGEWEAILLYFPVNSRELGDIREVFR